ncbi:MAG: class I SAM-dependent methyltransferase [Candidatus Peribacteria bacterium]|nr:MAG: class I SAM-dependent methyltransferase [Candidatus Peribacteria bacterium]
MAQQLGLSNVHTIWTRAEDHRETYDFVTARAVGHARKLLPRTKHLVKP